MKARWLVWTSVTALLLLGALTGQADATGPGGWDHLGGTAAIPALNAAVYALNADRVGALYVGGTFTSAGGVAGADRIAKWNGAAWSAVTPPEVHLSNGAVNAIAYDSVTGRLIVGGTFTDAGGNPNADFLGAWNGSAWTQVCTGGTSPPITATVFALQIIGRTLYIAGAFADGAGIPSADRVLACDLDTGGVGSTVTSEANEFTGTVYALTADSAGRLYAGGGFINLEGLAAADNVAYQDGSGWHAMGPGGGTCQCAGRRLRPQPHGGRHGRLRRHRRAERRGREGRPRRALGRHVARSRLEHRRHRRVVPGHGDDHRPHPRGNDHLRRGVVPERQRRSPRGQDRVVRRQRLARGRLRRRRQRSPARQRRRRRRPLRRARGRGRQLHERRR